MQHTFEKTATTETVVQTIKHAFKDVRLGTGVSIRQSIAIDQYCANCTEQQFRTLPLQEITEDWSAVQPDELFTIATGHLDAQGVRYYLPALMLSLLERYERDDNELYIIGTISTLYPKQDSWEYSMQRYALLNDTQKAAIAQYLVQLPRLVELRNDDAKCAERALRNYWGQFLPQSSTPS